MDSQLFKIFQKTIILLGNLEMAIITSHRLGFKKTTLQFPTPETGKLFSLPDLYYLLEEDKKI